MCKKFYYIIAVLFLSTAISCSDQKSSADKKSVADAPVEASLVEQTNSPNADGKEKFHVNLHYSAVNPAQPTQSKDNRIEVVEMFFYACPHCYKLEPTIEEWLKTKADDVDFVRVPAIIGPTWAEQAKAFYIAEELGMADEARKKMFDSIHKDGKQYYNEYNLMTFFTGLGVDRNRFSELYESPEILEKAGQAREKTVRYGIRGVPAIIVDGKYYTATYYTRDHKEMLEVVDFLIEKARKEQSSSKQHANVPNTEVQTTK